MTPRPVADPAAVAAALAARLPTSDVRALVQATRGGRDALTALRAESASAVLRRACDRLLDALASCSPEYLSGALAGALRAAEYLREAGLVEVVWTGPTSNVMTGRLTSAVIVDIIEEATEEVVLVSYAAHTEPTIADALSAAIERAVAVTVLVERREDNSEYRGSGKPFPGLPLRRLIWPGDARPTQGAALHAKVLVVDGRVALVGSANLTGRALGFNLECGVLLRGGDAPAQIRKHLLALVEEGTLRLWR